jgi:hypothetical protein
MMFTIVWSHTAFEQMNSILQASPERRASFAKTLRSISRQLHVDPLDTGESREGNRRVWFVDNLVVNFDVDVEDQTVEIGSVWLITTE